MRRLIGIAVLAVATGASGAPAVSAGDPRDRDDYVGATVHDVLGRRIGTVRDIEYDCEGDVLNVVIALGVLPGGGSRYVVVPWNHLDDSGGALKFRGARERLVDAPRRADDPQQR